MKLASDKIVFESRSEIDEVSYALGKFAEEHPEESCVESVKHLEKLLETMYIGW